MRQLVAFLEKIRLRNAKDEYYRTRNYAQIHGVEIKPIEEVLGVGSEEGERSFDESFDKHAEAKLKEMQAMKGLHGRATT